MTAAKRLLLIEDHALLSQSLAVSLRASGYDVSVSVGTTLEEIARFAAAVRPDVVLLDLELDGIGSGRQLIPSLRAGGAMVLMVTGETDDAELGACIQAGATAVISKALPFDGLLAVVEDAMAGRLGLQVVERDRWLAAYRGREGERRAVLEPFRLLTPREASTLALLVDGRPAEAIATETFVSLATVRSHIRSILAKLGVNSQLAAVALARRAGWPADAD